MIMVTAFLYGQVNEDMYLKVPEGALGVARKAIYYY